MRICKLVLVIFAVSMMVSSCGGGDGGSNNDGTKSSIPTVSPIPTVPLILIAYEVSDSQINLAWPASSDDVAVLGYNIYRKGAALPFKQSKVPAAIDMKLAPATKYCYQVSAFDGDGNESGRSSSACATTLAGPVSPSTPTVPQGLTGVAVSDVEIRLAWKASSDDVAVVSYNIYRNGFAFPFKVTTATTTTDTGLTPATQYSYQVSAVDGDGNESVLSDPVFVKTLSPLAPTFLSGAPDDANKTVCIFFDNTTVSASFNEPVRSTTVTSSSFRVAESSSGRVVAGTFDYTDPQMPVFTPKSGALLVNDSYTVSLTNGITDLDGNALKNPSSWSFTIDVPPVPCFPGETFNNDPSVCSCE